MSDENGEESLVNADESTQVIKPDKRLVDPDVVNSLVQQKVNKTAEKTKAETEARMNEEMDTMRSEYEEKLADMAEENKSNAYTDEQAYEAVVKRVNSEAHDEKVKELEGKYHANMESAKSSNEDYAEVMDGWNPSEFPNVSLQSALYEDGGQLVYELNKNETKLAEIDNLLLKSPAKGKKALDKMMSKIKETKRAKQESQQGHAPPPLDRIKPSQTNGSSGDLSSGSYRDADWMFDS